MRKIDFDEWKKQKSRVTALRLRAGSSLGDRVAGNRPRDPEQERVLSAMDKARWERYIQSGKLQILGPRLWKWRIDFKD